MAVAGEPVAEKKSPVQLDSFEISEEAPPLIRVGEYALAEPRAAFAAVASDRYIYTFGGSNGPHILGEVQRFDPETGRTIMLPQFVMRRRYHEAARVGDKVYIFGGINGGLGSQEIAEVEIFDLNTGKVTFGRKNPFPTKNAGVAVHDGKIYLIGGGYLRGTARYQTNRVNVYDPATDSWSEAAPMSKPRECTAVTVGDFIVATGGYRSSQNLDTVEAFNPVTNSWSLLPSLCRTMGASSVVFLDHYLFLFSDFRDKHVLLAYDLKTKTSRELNVGFTPRQWATGVLLKDRIYVLGGVGGIKGMGVQMRGNAGVTGGENEVATIEVFRRPAFADKR